MNRWAQCGQRWERCAENGTPGLNMGPSMGTTKESKPKLHECLDKYMSISIN